MPLPERILHGACSANNPCDVQELLPEPDMFGQRARSASDASVLRRKGHLKEQDQMIEFLLQMHVTHTSMETMVKMERWIEHHRKVLWHLTLLPAQRVRVLRLHAAGLQ